MFLFHDSGFVFRFLVSFFAFAFSGGATVENDVLAYSENTRKSGKELMLTITLYYCLTFDQLQIFRRGKRCWIQSLPRMATLHQCLRHHQQYNHNSQDELL